MRILSLPILLILAGCSSWGRPVPGGHGSIVVSLPGLQGAPLDVHLTLGGLFDEHRHAAVAADRPASFDGLGAETYHVELHGSFDMQVVDGRSVTVKLGEGERRAIVFTLLPAAKIRVHVTNVEAAGIAVVAALPDRLLGATLTKQRDWCGRFGAYKAIDQDGEIDLLVPASDEAMWVAVAGPMTFSFALFDALVLPDLGAPEAIRLAKIGPLKEGEVTELRHLRVPWVKAAPPALKGRLIDSADRPVAGGAILLLPTGDGTGAMVLTDEQGRYAVPALPSGDYRVSLSGVIDDQVVERAFVLELTGDGKVQDLVLR